MIRPYWAIFLRKYYWCCLSTCLRQHLNAWSSVNRFTNKRNPKSNTLSRYSNQRIRCFGALAVGNPWLTNAKHLVIWQSPWIIGSGLAKRGKLSAQANRAIVYVWGICMHCICGVIRYRRNFFYTILFNQQAKITHSQNRPLSHFRRTTEPKKLFVF